ncbi:hypothetical protein T439DRAFT_330115 [Meredithblackwellia eburnea MCA 4105]
MARLQLLASVLLLIQTSSALLVKGRLDLVNTTIEPTAFVTLSSASSNTIRAPVLEDLSFAINAPEAGDYLLTVNSRKWDFLPYRVRVPVEANPTSLEVQVYQPGPSTKPFSGAKVVHPLVIPTSGEIVYFEVSKPFDVVKLVKGNPLLVLLGVLGLMSVAMPYLMQSLDPETLREVSENQRELHSKMAAFQNMDISSGVSKLLAPSGDEAKAESVAPSPSKAGGGGGKKRR